MTDSLRLLLERSLDYAGLFPPATLPLAQAGSAFAADLAGPQGWMLGRWVCPAAKLGELGALLAEGPPPAAPLPISVLGRNGKTAGEFLAGLDADLSALTTFRRRVEARASISSVELRLPVEVFDSAVLRKLLVTIEALLARVPDNGLQPFFELPPTPSLPAQLAVLAEHNAATPARQLRPAGLKLRTGGPDASTFPSVAQLAAALVAAAAAGLPLKCTGGLHHALPHPSTSLGVRMHGFVNVLAAAVLATAPDVDSTTVADLLGETDPAAFGFEPAALAWRDRRFDLPAVRAARQRLLVAFGCCYLDRPRSALVAAGWQ